MKIILFEPEIPQNTGNVVRTCSVTGSDLILVEPLGFSINDRWLKRAGLDYWEGVAMETIDDLDQYLERCKLPFTFFSSHATTSYTDIKYSTDHLLIFGSETSGLPDRFLKKWSHHFATVPMRPGARCLNLATTVGIVTYEAWRQNNFNTK
ncbi:MAG: tRNA (cytidine(34)-2'-O)-methyltransferase [Chlamydiales bacterium]|nr:tRNA (cytidine(34)-2'-O)-methyltransferase [Chlamydiia bacterium]MCP5506935.1 tRNA (cytidine(34)-2'-O)-methyltransferase [Chlamydiales bacterium]